LEATLFWQAMGFVPVGVREGGKSKKKLHIKFATILRDSTLALLFETPKIEFNWRENFLGVSPMAGRALRRPFHTTPLFLEE
jgi:hypothetical protein